MDLNVLVPHAADTACVIRPKKSSWIVVPLVVLQQLPKVGFWIVFFALAWPLFKDINATLGLDLRSLFQVFSRGKEKPSSSSDKKPRLSGRACDGPATARLPRAGESARSENRTSSHR